jgi:hypothetical protein
MKFWAIICGIIVIFAGYSWNSAIVDLIGLGLLAYGLIKKDDPK